MNKLKVIQKFLKAARRPKHAPQMTWSQAARAASLEFGNGHPMSPGLAQMIALKDYDPQNETFRTAYGLGPRRCAHCHQRIRAKKLKTKNRAERSLPIRWWYELSQTERRTIIESAYSRKFSKRV